MLAVFCDTRDKPNPLNGTQIRNGEEWSRLFDKLEKAEAFVCEFEGENGYKLGVGLAPKLGCAQYSRTDGEPPYMVAVATEITSEDGCIDFMYGNELTEVPNRECLPLETIKEIVAYFIETGLRSPNVAWEQI
jgi:hypothetical protein